MKLMRRTAATQAAGDAVFTARCHHGYPAAWQCERTDTVPLLVLSTGPSPVQLPDGWSTTAVAQLGGRTAALCPEHSPRPATVDRSGYIEAPHRHAPDGRPTVFLAGGIQSCEDWQSQARTVLADVPGLVVLNPRRADFPLGNPDAEAEQVAWESEHLRIADLILFWFPRSVSHQPIALFELGLATQRWSRLVVGADPAYLRRNNIVEQLSHLQPHTVVHSTLPSTLQAARSMLESLRPAS